MRASSRRRRDKTDAAEEEEEEEEEEVCEAEAEGKCMRDCSRLRGGGACVEGVAPAPAPIDPPAVGSTSSVPCLFIGGGPPFPFPFALFPVLVVEVVVSAFFPFSISSAKSSSSSSASFSNSSKCASTTFLIAYSFVNTLNRYNPAAIIAPTKGANK